MKTKNFATKIWDILYPWLLYYAVTILVMFLSEYIIGQEAEKYIICQMITSVAAFAVMYVKFYRSNQQQEKKKENKSRRARIGNVLGIVIVIFLLAVGLNNLILMSPLAASEGYEEAAEHFYAGTFAIEIISSAILTPMVEELVYRGILFARLKKMMGMIPAMFVASLIFAIMHFNLVQFVYAFLLGLVLTVFMEKTGHVYGAMIGHMIANALAVIRTETGFLDEMLDGSLFAWGTSVACVVLGIAALAGYILLQRNHS